MKILVTITVFALTATFLCSGKYAGWNKSEKPRLSLIEAHTKALEALKPRNIDFYCLSASVARTFSECDWELHFAAANNVEMWVSVGTDKVRVSEHGFEY